MHEQAKIREAEYFLQRLRDARDPEHTRHEVSAFLTAARSVLQYAREHARQKTAGQAWYDDAFAASDAVVAFLKDSRDINIHNRPVPLRTHLTIAADPDYEFSTSNATPILLPPSQTVRSYRCVFKGWSGPEEVLQLCERYLAEIKRIVADGEARGFLR